MGYPVFWGGIIRVVGFFGAEQFTEVHFASEVTLRTEGEFAEDARLGIPVNDKINKPRRLFP